MIILPDDWYEKNGLRCPYLRPFKRVAPRKSVDWYFFAVQVVTIAISLAVLACVVGIVWGAQ